MYLFNAILCPIIDAGIFSNGFKGMQSTSCSKKGITSRYLKRRAIYHHERKTG
jgi:hypothetical protein